MARHGTGTHRFDPTIREYDIRGIVGQTLSAADARAIGRASRYPRREAGGSRVAVGYDGRLTSPELEAALVDGLAMEGARCRADRPRADADALLRAATLGVDGGVMVTGSHNPPEYNGFKMMLGQVAFYGAAIQQLGEIGGASGSYAERRARTGRRAAASATTMSRGWRATIAAIGR